MNYKATSDRIADYRRQIAELRVKMRAAQAAIATVKFSSHPIY